MDEIFESSKESLDVTTEKLNETDDDQSALGTQNTSIDMDSSPAKTENEVLKRFRTIVTEYLNGEAVGNLEVVTREILGSYSLAGYLDFAMPAGREIIVTKLLQQCCFILQDLLRVSDGICYAHEEPAAAVIQLIQMQLLNLYPKYSTQGYEALYSCPPTIYISPLCTPSLGNLICKKLGFPSNCVKIMKMNDPQLSKMEKSLQEDIAAKRVPLMIIACCGSHHSGQVDNLVAISQLSQRFNTWLHLEGQMISHLSLHDQPRKTLQVADSLHLDLRQLLGVPSLPYVTMYRHCEIALQRAACLTPLHCSPFSVVPLWFALQNIDASTISARFKNAVDVSMVLVNHLIATPNIKFMSYLPKMIKSPSMESRDVVSDSTEENRPTGSDDEDKEDGKQEENSVAVEVSNEIDEQTRPSSHNSSSDSDKINHMDDDEVELTAERTKPEALMNNITPVVVFQYRPKIKGAGECPGNLLDDLNLWLIQVLERACEDIHMDIIDVDESGYALRFSPFDCKTFPTVQTMEGFCETLNQQLEILNATVSHKTTLINLINSSEELQLVELPGWAGLGGVRYLPSAWRSKNVEQLPDQGKEEINKINRELVAKLKQTDSAFSLGEGKDGLSCVRFGMVVAITDVEALANLVRVTGIELEESTLALETMAVMIRKGIEEAQAELQRETEEKLWEEGLLRHIPVVGSLVNYFSPPQKTAVKGRSLNLQKGRVETSDVVIHPPVEEASDALVNQEMPSEPLVAEERNEEERKEISSNIE